jgi:hypothetical protein
VIVAFRQPLNFAIKLDVLLQIKFLRVHFEVLHEEATMQVIGPFLWYWKVGETHNRLACVGNRVPVDRTLIRASFVSVIPRTAEARILLKARRLQASVNATLDGRQSSDTATNDCDFFSHHSL